MRFQGGMTRVINKRFYFDFEVFLYNLGQFLIRPREAQRKIDEHTMPQARQ